MSDLDRRYLFHAELHPAPPPGGGFVTDLAQDPSAAHELIKLGVSPRKDLPAVLMTDAGKKLRVMGLRLNPQEAEAVMRGGRVDSDDTLRVYSATWCPDCKRLKARLEDLGVEFDEIDLDTNLEAEARVLEKSGGRRVVPTLEQDGRFFLFNPSMTVVDTVFGNGPGADS